MEKLSDVLLKWDAWNISHIRERHGIERHQVEEVFGNTPRARETHKDRLLVVGPTSAGLMLSVIIGPVPDALGFYYPFSARPASRQERRWYKQQ